MGSLPPLDLPWPDRILHPNARPDRWRKARAAKAYRQECKLLAMNWLAKASVADRAAIEAVLATPGKLVLDLTFHPPSHHRRDDDGCPAAFKSGRDGLADALRIDDSRFATRFRLEPWDRDGPHPFATTMFRPRYGWVAVRIGEVLP